MTALADRTWIHMAGGFAAMGGWAVFANAAHPMPGPLIAGLVQGTMTALITLGMKRMLEALIIRLPGVTGRVLPPLAAFALSVTVLSLIHTAAGTPEVLRTLAVPTTVATIYAAIYTQRVWKAHHG